MADPAFEAITRIQQAEQESDFDLDNWIRDFESCFPDYEKINPTLKEGFWGRGFSNRPRIKELNEQADAKINQGYRVIEYFPDRDQKKESFILFGTPLQLQSQIALLNAIYQIVENKEIGNFEQFEELVFHSARLPPKTGVAIRIYLTTYKRPPYYKLPGEWFKKKRITIPMVNTAKLNYKNIREACGGSAGQNWGEYKAIAVIQLGDNQSGYSKIIVGGNSERSAVQNLERFLDFTDAKVVGVTTNKIDYTKGVRAKDSDRHKYNSYDVYPSWMVALNTDLIQTESLLPGRQTLAGKQRKVLQRLLIYTEREPAGWNEDLRALIRHKFYSS
jgi:hypothetical protein